MRLGIRHNVKSVAIYIKEHLDGKWKNGNRSKYITIYETTIDEVFSIVKKALEEKSK